MKLYEILSENDELSTNISKTRLTDEEFGLAYNKLMRNPMSKEEINDFITQMVEEGKYPRSVGSLKFVMHRMHMILHGEAADGVTAIQAKAWFQPSRPMEDYVIRRGDLDAEDIQSHLEHAREDLINRTVVTKVKKEDALKMMSDFYRQNRDRIVPGVKDARGEIVQQIMNGTPADQAFAPYMQ